MTQSPVPQAHKPAIAPWSRLALVAIGIIGLISFSKATESEASVSVHIEKVVGTPRFFQCDPRADFAGGGRDYCGPTAVSDSLMYLGHHGFDRLLPRGIADPMESQIALINILASPECMNTDPAAGTNPGQTCRGLEHYVEAAGYVCRTIEYRGWRPVSGSAACYSTATPLSLDWIKKAVADPHGAAWIGVGWYVHGDAPDEWKRVGGHWLAVVGFGVDGNGHTDPRVLLLDNPADGPTDFERTEKHAPRRRLADGTELPTNDEIAAEVTHTVLLEHGRLVGNYPGLPRDAAGLYGVWGDGVDTPAEFDAAIMDGAVVMVIDNRRQ